MIIRHLILPGQVENSKNVLKWINENMPKSVYVSLMAQYFPTYKAKKIEQMNRKISKEEYEEIENYLYSLDLDNGYIQELNGKLRYELGLTDGSINMLIGESSTGKTSLLITIACNIVKRFAPIENPMDMEKDIINLLESN